ncbi:MAG: SRPBCC family protein [Alphaproteobacteria bacterium]|nr:SRPBCC family protein [Alphaproteobacteria bacterium]
MKKCASKGFAALIAVLAVLAFIIAMQTSEFQVTRTATIAAPPAKLFPLVNDLRKWESWSPWAKLDPNAKHSFEGPRAGKGAIMHWDGNMQVGKGSMTITESRPSSAIKFQLDFTKPLKGTSTAEFTFKPEGKNTAVTWSMQGKKDFLAKAISLISSCEKMVGGQFEKGLANLKAIAEKR